MQRRKTVPVSLGRLTLGGERIYIQSMLNVPSTDIPGSVAQAVALEEAKEVNEAEQSFLSKMSYDIRRPVNVKDILNTLKESKYTITSEPLKGAE